MGMWQSVKEYVPAVLKKWQGLVISLAGIIGITLNIWKWPDVPAWVWIVIIVIGLIIAQFLAFHELRKKQAKPPKNWIDAHKAIYGKFPPIPDYLLPVVLPSSYSQGGPVTKDVKLTTASGQFWNNLLPSQKDELMQLVEWLGEDPRDYEAAVLKMLPRKSPKGPGRWTPFKQD
jgi:hypothetical protein